MQSILYLSFAMIGGLALSRLMKKVHLPNVTGYLIAGLLIGPFVLHLIPKDAISSLDTITMVALGFIAFSIGGEFRFSNIKAIGAKSITITLFQSLGTAILVDTVLILCGFDIPLALCNCHCDCSGSNTYGGPPVPCQRTCHQYLASCRCYG